MKKLVKSIIAAMLCAVITISAISTETAQAADTQTVKVTFNKKSVNLKVTDTGTKKVSLKTLKKKWGKPSSTKKTEYRELYTWKKGKSCVCYDEIYESLFSHYQIEINDKNGAACGIKVGTKADKALKILEKFDADVTESDSEISVIFVDSEPRTQIAYRLKGGKVSSIWGMLYISQ